MDNDALLLAGEPYRPAEVRPVDGDTLRVDGVSVRVSNLDTPETGGRADCDAERLLAALATREAAALLSRGEVVVWPEGRADRYRRPLVRVTIDGADFGRAMVDAGVAVPSAGGVPEMRRGGPEPAPISWDGALVYGGNHAASSISIATVPLIAFYGNLLDARRKTWGARCGLGWTWAPIRSVGL